MRFLTHNALNERVDNRNMGERWQYNVSTTDIIITYFIIKTYVTERMNHITLLINWPGVDIRWLGQTKLAAFDD